MEDPGRRSLIGLPDGPVFLLIVCLVTLGFGARTALGQSTAGLTTTVSEVTSTVDSTVDDTTSAVGGAVEDTSGAAEETLGSVSGGGGTSGSESSSGDASDSTSSPADTSSGGGSEFEPRASSSPKACGERSRHARALALFMTAFTGRQAGILAAKAGRNTRSGAGIAGAIAGSPPGPALAREFPSLLPGTDFWHSPLAIVAWAVVGLGIAALLAAVFRFWTGRWNP